VSKAKLKISSMQMNDVNICYKGDTFSPLFFHLLLILSMTLLPIRVRVRVRVRVSPDLVYDAPSTAPSAHLALA